jgi:hypothetical protein
MFMRHNQNRFANSLMALNIAEHVAIHDALTKRDPRASALAMRAHITAAAKQLGYGLSPDAIKMNLLGRAWRVSILSFSHREAHRGRESFESFRAAIRKRKPTHASMHTTVSGLDL